MRRAVVRGLAIDFGDISERRDDEADDLVLSMEVKHGHPVILPQADKLVGSWTILVVALKRLEQILGTLQAAAMFSNDLDRDRLQLCSG